MLFGQRHFAGERREIARSKTLLTA